MTSENFDLAAIKALADALPVMVFVADARGRNTYTNSRFQTFSGLPAEKLLGNGWLDALHADDRSKAQRNWEQAVTHGDAYESEYRFRRHDGVYRWHLCNSNAVHDERGRVMAWVGTCTDVEEHQRAASDMRELLETLPVGVLLAHDPDCERISGNPAAAAMLRMPVGGNFSKSAPADQRPLHFRLLRDGKELSPADLPVQRAARGEIVHYDEVEIVFDDGDVVPVVLSARPLFDSIHQVRGAVGTLMDVSRLKEAEAALRVADRRKDELIAILAHELRNPLASLQTGLDLLQRTVPPAAGDSVGDMMQRQVIRLAQVVDDLLDVSRVSRGEITLQVEALDLNSVIDAALETSQSVLARHRVVQERMTGALPVQADQNRLTQVISHLLRNAAHYSEPGSTIRLSSERIGQQAVVRVKDFGAGIEPHRREEIFEMFTRVPVQPGSVSSSGLGVGLSFAWHMVSMHGGTIEMESAGPGQGSQFTVRLPIVLPADAGTADAGMEEAGMEEAPDSPDRRRVLVVDDNVDGANALGALLSLEGHEARVVHDGPAALEALQSYPADLVILDIGLPGMSGYEVAERIREMPNGQRMRLIAITGWGQDRDRARSREAGIDEHITKPVGADSLQRLIAGIGARETS